MNKDFHFYGTYVAAKTAGFNNEDAAVIAYAAQYVNDSSNEKIKSDSGFFISDFEPVPTVQTNLEIFKNFTMDMLTERLQNQTARVWSCFHFLPGNYTIGSKKNYSGEKNSKASGDSWTFDKKAEEQFRLMCLPSSEIVLEMVNDITSYQKLKPYFLHVLGLRMHSLADTWAHMYHGGLSAWFMNDAYDVQELGPDLKPNRSPVLWTNDPFFNDSLAIHKYSCTPRSEFYNSFSYLGHGRMGYFPDYGFKRYSYRPNWSESPIIKDNQSDFLLAFRQMVKAMQCVREGIPFDNGFAELPYDVEREVKKVLATVALDQTNAWKHVISTLGYKEPPNYNENAWLNAYQASPSRFSDYYCFNVAAVLQINLVKEILKRNHIYIDEIPSSNNIKVRLENAGRLFYFGKAVKYANHDYPSLGLEGVELSLINPGGPLRSGDIVEIRTNEENVSDDYSYLTAFSTTSLYYHTREFGMNRSKWLIRLKDEEDGTLITNGKQVFIKNVHFEKKPFMEPYYAYMPPTGDYITTAAESGRPEQLWMIELTD